MVLLIGLSSLIFFSTNNPSYIDTSVDNQDSFFEGNPVVPILMYHEVKPSMSGKDSITPFEFESDLQYLNDQGYNTVTMTDLINFVEEGKELPEKPIIISFDDGYYNTYIYTFPLIKKYNIKIVLSIIGKSCDEFTANPEKNIDYSHATWTQLNEMIDSGLVEVQNHTYDMHTNKNGRFGCTIKSGESIEHYKECLSADLLRLQNEITLFTGTTPNTFTYPYGRISKESIPIIKELGFRASLSCDYGVNIMDGTTESLFGLKRICRVHGTSAQKSIDGGMKTLKYIHKNK